MHFATTLMLLCFSQVASYTTHTINASRAFAHPSLRSSITSSRYIKPSSRTLTTLAMSTPSSDSYDLLVIGGGSGGMATARRSANFGQKVGVIERGRMGGTCVNVGCVPKKVMWNAAFISEILHDMSNYGFTGKADFNWAFLKSRRDMYVKRLNGIYESNLAGSDIDKIDGLAKLTSNPNEVVVTASDGSATTVSAKNILLAPGGYPTFPPGEGIAEHAISSDGFFDLEDLPARTVVVGAGYIAVELAGVLNALGSDVTLVLRKSIALREFDEMLSSTLDSEMQRQGIKIERDTGGVEKITLNGEGKKDVLLQNGVKVDGADVVLMATGRSPLVDPLDLPAAGVEQLPSGHVKVDEYSATSVPNIFALGDVCGNVELTPMAIAAGRRLADRLFDGKSGAKVSYDMVPTVVFSHPTIGTIGMSEKQAKDMYGEENVRVYNSRFANLYYGVFDIPFADKPPTRMKLVCVGDTEQVVGLHSIGMGSDELLQGFGVAMKMGCTKADLDSCIAIHPTAAEELVTMGTWGTSPDATGAKVSPLNGADVLPKAEQHAKL